MSELKYTGGVAWHRVKAMHVFKEIPSLEAHLLSGELKVTSVTEIGQFFDNEAAKKRPFSSAEKCSLLESCVGKSVREVSRILL